MGSTGSAWLLGTDEISKHRYDFARTSRPVFNHLAKGFDYLFNFVDARNLLSLAWVKWLGFRIYPAAPYGHARLPFHPIEWRRT